MSIHATRTCLGALKTKQDSIAPGARKAFSQAAAGVKKRGRRADPATPFDSAPERHFRRLALGCLPGASLALLDDDQLPRHREAAVVAGHLVEVHAARSGRT